MARPACRYARSGVIRAPRARRTGHREFASSQLLEFRYYDQLPDSELARIYARLQSHDWRRTLVPRRYARNARRVHSLFVDVHELTDKTENALKMAGDVYAARLFGLAAARLGLRQWKESVREKVDTADNRDMQGRTLERVIVARESADGECARRIEVQTVRVKGSTCGSIATAR